MGAHPHVELAARVATVHGLNPALVCALVEQESGWNPYAVRCESEAGFAARYGAAYIRIVQNSASQYDNKWIRFEDLFYSSYGLLQTMYPVVVEMLPDLAAKLPYPTQLCDPETGLTAGCRIFRKKLDLARGDLSRALLFWNGGGRPEYVSEVLGRMGRYEA